MSKKSPKQRSYTNMAAASACGVSERTIKNWRARGWIVDRPDGTLDVAATAARVQAHRDPTLGGQPHRQVGGAVPLHAVAREPRVFGSRVASRPSTDTHSTVGSDATRLLQARALKETLAGKALRLAIEEREGRLIDRQEAERVYVESITEARTRMEAIPGRLASRLVGLDACAIRDILRDEIETALRTVSRLPEVGCGEGGVS